MVIIYAAGIVSAVVVILILAYLYRESAAISGKGKVQVGPVKVELEGQAQKEPDVQSLDASKIKQTATDQGRIVRSGPEIQGGTGEIKQEASGGGVIEDSAPKIS